MHTKLHITYLFICYLIIAFAYLPLNKMIKEYEKLFDSQYFSENEEYLMSITL